MRVLDPLVDNGRPIGLQCEEIGRRLRWPFRRRLTAAQRDFLFALFNSYEAIAGAHLLDRLCDADLALAAEKLTRLPQGITSSEANSVLSRLAKMNKLNFQTAKDALRLSAWSAGPDIFKAVLDVCVRDMDKAARGTIGGALFEICDTQLAPQNAEVFAQILCADPLLLEDACFSNTVFYPEIKRPLITLLHSQGNALSSSTLERFHRIFENDPVSVLFEPSHHRAMQRHRMAHEIGVRRILTMSNEDFSAALPTLDFT